MKNLENFHQAHFLLSKTNNSDCYSPWEVLPGNSKSTSRQSSLKNHHKLLSNELKLSNEFLKPIHIKSPNISNQELSFESRKTLNSSLVSIDHKFTIHNNDTINDNKKNSEHFHRVLKNHLRKTKSNLAESKFVGNKENFAKQ